MKERGIRWVEHVARMVELRNLYETATKSRKENPFVRISSKWKTILSY
jgi:hypothetical protein